MPSVVVSRVNTVSRKCYTHCTSALGYQPDDTCCKTGDSLQKPSIGGRKDCCSTADPSSSWRGIGCPCSIEAPFFKPAKTLLIFLSSVIPIMREAEGKRSGNVLTLTLPSPPPFQPVEKGGAGKVAHVLPRTMTRIKYTTTSCSSLIQLCQVPTSMVAAQGLQHQV